MLAPTLLVSLKCFLCFNFGRYYDLTGCFLNTGGQTGSCDLAALFDQQRAKAAPKMFYNTQTFHSELQLCSRYLKLYFYRESKRDADVLYLSRDRWDIPLDC